MEGGGDGYEVMRIGGDAGARARKEAVGGRVGWTRNERDEKEMMGKRNGSTK